MTFGMPYKGSKSKIAKEIISLLPKADFFVDVFAGGCAVTDCAMRSGKWNRFIANDINGYPKVFKEIVNGKPIPYRWISREEFFRLKDTDPIIAMCWSFGSDARTYIFGKKIEPQKKAAFEAVVNLDIEPLREFGIDASEILKMDTIKERRQALKRLCQRARLHQLEQQKRDERHECFGRLESVQSLECLERLERVQSLERLERLERVQSLERLEPSALDYRTLDIPPDSVVYCDPPYKGTSPYGSGDFDHDSFYDWCERQSAPVFISEYWMPEDRFVCVWQKQVVTTMSASSNSIKRIEKIFRPKKQLENAG